MQEGTISLFRLHRRPRFMPLERAIKARGAQMRSARRMPLSRRAFLDDRPPAFLDEEPYQCAWREQSHTDASLHFMQVSDARRGILSRCRFLTNIRRHRRATFAERRRHVRHDAACSSRAPPARQAEEPQQALKLAFSMTHYSATRDRILMPRSTVKLESAERQRAIDKFAGFRCTGAPSLLACRLGELIAASQAGDSAAGTAGLLMMGGRHRAYRLDVRFFIGMPIRDMSCESPF